MPAKPSRERLQCPLSRAGKIHILPRPCLDLVAVDPRGLFKCLRVHAEPEHEDHNCRTDSSAAVIAEWQTKCSPQKTNRKSFFASYVPQCHLPPVRIITAVISFISMKASKYSASVRLDR